MQTQERNRQQQASSEPVLAQIDELLTLLGRQVAQLDREIAALLQDNAGWRGRVQLLRSIPRRGAGAGLHSHRPTARTGSSQPQGNRRAGWSGPPTTGTAASGAANAPCGADGGSCAPSCTWQPWSLPGTIRHSAPATSVCWPRARRRKSPSPRACASCSPSATPSSNPTPPGKTLSPPPQGLFKVLVGGLSPRTVNPAKAGIQNIPITTTSWIPAFAGMTD